MSEKEVATTPRHLEEFAWYKPHQAWMRGLGFSFSHDPEEATPCRANLGHANLGHANLENANLGHANLENANLRYANLRYANLRHANLENANLGDANLENANLENANLGYANLRYANLRYANLGDIPKVSRIDAAILAQVDGDRPAGFLEMGDWHVCKTTHCRGGWAIYLAGEAGEKLELKVGASNAASLIYAKSRPGVLLPDFYCSNEEAMTDLRRCAAEDG